MSLPVVFPESYLILVRFRSLSQHVTKVGCLEPLQGHNTTDGDFRVLACLYHSVKLHVHLITMRYLKFGK